MSFVQTPDGTLLRVVTRGPSDAPPVVLVHGWKQSHRLFDQAIHRLSASHRVIAYDQRGMGESDKPDGPYDFRTLGADLHAILEWTNAEDAVVVGWSMGCTTALSAVDLDPEPIGALVLVNGPIRLTSVEGFPWALSEGDLSAYVEGMEASWPGDQRDFLRSSLLPEHESCLPLLEYAALQTPLYTALSLVREQAKVDHRQTIAGCPVPMLAAYSDRDPYWPVGLAEWIARTAPDGRSHVFTASAHCPPLEEPEEFCRVVRDFALTCGRAA